MDFLHAGVRQVFHQVTHYADALHRSLDAVVGEVFYDGFVAHSWLLLGV